MQPTALFRPETARSKKGGSAIYPDPHKLDGRCTLPTLPTTSYHTVQEAFIRIQDLVTSQSVLQWCKELVHLVMPSCVIILTFVIKEDDANVATILTTLFQTQLCSAYCRGSRVIHMAQREIHEHEQGSAREGLDDDDQATRTTSGARCSASWTKLPSCPLRRHTLHS